MANFKFHAIAILAISLIIFGLYNFVGFNDPVIEQAATPQPGDRQVHIVGASWGENCNEEINRVLQERASAPLQTDASGKVIEAEKLQLVKADNALEVLRKTCDKQFGCALRANIETLGFDPMQTCYKTLVVSYRCFDFDRLNTATANQGDVLKIDCRANAAATHQTH